MLPPVAEAVLAFHGVRRLDGDSEESVGGLPSWLVGLLMICGLCCCLAAIGKYKFEADGAQRPVVLPACCRLVAGLLPACCC